MGRAPRAPKPPASKRGGAPRAPKPPASKRGGARPGAGRKREKLPAEVLARLGPPPIAGGTKALREWNGKLLAEVQWLSLNGQVSADLAASIRANAGSLDRALPELPKLADDDDAGDNEETEGGERVEAQVVASAVAGGELRVGNVG